MINNVFKKIAKSIMNLIPLHNVIVFESCPDYSDNTKAVFDEFVKKGINKKYKMIWFVDGKERFFDKQKNIKSIQFKSFKANFYRYVAKCIICCNRFVFTEKKKQFRMYLGHGNPLKNTKGYYEIPKEFDYILTSSEGMRSLRNSFYGISLDRMFSLGYPRNDILTQKPINIKQLFISDFKKIIVWYPTVRQFKNGNQTGSSHALPVVWDERKAIELNNCANENGVLIVLKPHFAQDLSFLKTICLSNIVFIDDSFFIKNNITSYQFVGSCDAMLTDFSSIYYDYTLCDKPIGLIWEDYDEYKNNPGFAVDMGFMMKGGVKIYNLNDLKKFVVDVAGDIDVLKNERREIRDFANCATDGNNTKRVCDFIAEKAHLKT